MRLRPLPAHGYARRTEDIDFAIAVPPSELPALAYRMSEALTTVLEMAGLKQDS